jgi:iron complex outermembrane receptor protein
MHPSSQRHSFHHYLRCTAFSLPLFYAVATPQSAMAEEANSTLTLPPTIITATPIANTKDIYISTDAISTPTPDLAEMLRDMTGIEAIRKSGHGLDPVIRGQRKGQINVYNNGALLQGACPFRMDPPTSLAAMENADSIVVHKGYITVTQGAGAPGGYIELKRLPPELGYHGTATFGAESSASRLSGSVDASARDNVGWVRGGYNLSTQQDYKDGNGDAVRSGVKSRGGFLEIGLTPTDSNMFIARFDSQTTEDARFATSGMDSIYDDNKTFQLSWDHDTDLSWLNSWHVSGFGTIVEHTMDNFSERTPGMMPMSVDINAQTYGVTAKANSTIGVANVDYGISMRHQNFTYDVMESYLTQTGAFVEAKHPIFGVAELTAGLRYDHVAATFDKNKAAKPGSMMAPSPNAQYMTYYGVTPDDKNENNVGGLLRIERTWNQLSLSGGVSRAVRTADPVERFIANRNRIGNPNIDPEKHHQADINAGWQADTWSVSSSAYIDYVDDYILEDSARSQADIRATDPSKTVFRNVDAMLTGLELEAAWDITPDLNLFASAAYTYGENRSDSMPLAQIAPLSGRFTLTYTQPDWSLGSTVRYALTQTRVDTDRSVGTGLDTGKTSGYAVVDISGSYQLTEIAKISAGIDNVLDHTYANHLNYPNGYDSTVLHMNEPGRSFYMMLRAKF